MKDFPAILILLFCCACGRSQGLSPLAKAIYDHDDQKVEELLRSGENPNQQDQLGGTPLVFAIYNDDTVILKTLINHGAKVHSPFLLRDGETLFELSMSVRKFGAAKFFLNNRFFTIDEPDSIGETPLYRFCESFPAVSFLLKNGANPNYLCSISLGSSIAKSTAMDELIDRRVGNQRLIKDVGADSITLTLWNQNNILQNIEALLNAGAKPYAHAGEDTGYTYLHDAAAWCDTALTHVLLQYGADKNAKDSSGERPYDLAAKNHCPELEAMLK